MENKIEPSATQSTEPTNKPDFESAEVFLKKAYDRHRTEVIPDHNWAEWDTCKKDGTIPMVLEAMESYKDHHVQAMQEENERLKIEVNNWKILHDMVKESGIDKGKKAYERGELLAKADEIIDLIKDGIPLDFTNAVNTSGKEFLIKIEEYKSLKSTKPEDRPTSFFSDQPGGELK